MIDFAYKYKEELNKLYIDQILGNDYYKYWLYGSYWKFDIIDIEEKDDEWDTVERVSIKDKKIVGLFSSKISRPENNVSSISILSFNNSNGFQLLRDLDKFIDYLFTERKVNKISFSCVIKNPAKKIYDKFIEINSGKVVGIKEKEIMLIDHELYDVILYEVLRENYIKGKL